jgi:hypothetical protein
MHRKKVLFVEVEKIWLVVLFLAEEKVGSRCLLEGLRNPLYKGV